MFWFPRQRENSQGIRLRRVLWGETKFRGKTLHSCRFSGIRQEEDKATSATLNCAMQMPEVEVGVARFSDLTSQANNEGELVYRRADWEYLVHQRGRSSAGGLFISFCDLWAH
ncbi:hypothetical protein P4200_12250 [Pseudomonas aeruginosa]|nr:hypothetical protein [Pseudomonas aeruginosa]